MKKISFLYYGSNKLGRWIICARLSSMFSHVAIKFGDDVYQSTMLDGTHRVKAKDVDDYIYEQVIQVTDEEYELALQQAIEFEGQSYDKKALFGFALGSLSQSDDNLFCSEYGLKIFEAFSGVKVPMFNLVSPCQLRLVIETWLKTAPSIENN